MYNLGITLSIDQQGLKMKDPVKLFVHPCLSGPFVLPEDYKAVSPAYLLKADAEFPTDIRVCIQHCVSLKSEEDCTDMKFLSASPTPLNMKKQPFYAFSEIKESAGKFNVGGQIGEINIKKSGLILVANFRGDKVVMLVVGPPNKGPATSSIVERLFSSQRFLLWEKYLLGHCEQSFVERLSSP